MASENAGGGDTPSNAAAAPDTAAVPDELICSLCRDLLTDAVMIPCCGNSFCDECEYVIESSSADYTRRIWLWLSAYLKFLGYTFL